MTKRLPSGEERDLFEEVLADAKPLKGRAPRTKAPKPSAPKQEPKSVPVPRPELPAARPRTGPSGLDGRTADRLRRGQLAPEARLDLHGLTETSAHRALLTFVRGAQARGLRLVLVVTGKGAKRDLSDAPFDMETDRRARGVLRSMTPRWLQGRDLENLVADVRSAHRRHGGDGALYVYLRKRAP
ncbi:MAG TPA: Smr/MutS family protein [Rhizomicrobium sp.]